MYGLKDEFPWSVVSALELNVIYNSFIIYIIKCVIASKIPPKTEYI